MRDPPYESDVDCGGVLCGPCGESGVCLTNDDCTTGNCVYYFDFESSKWENRCAPQGCTPDFLDGEQVVLCEDGSTWEPDGNGGPSGTSGNGDGGSADGGDSGDSGGGPQSCAPGLWMRELPLELSAGTSQHFVDFSSGGTAFLYGRKFDTSAQTPCNNGVYDENGRDYLWSTVDPEGCTTGVENMLFLYTQNTDPSYEQFTYVYECSGGMLNFVARGDRGSCARETQSVQYSAMSTCEPAVCVCANVDPQWSNCGC